MNGAELDTRRRALGLSVAETAAVLGVGARTVGYWFAGDGEPSRPDELAARLREVEDTMGDLVDDLREQIDDEEECGRVCLRRYRTQAALDAAGIARGLPIGAYSMTVAWAIDDLRGDGHAVTVEWAG